MPATLLANTNKVTNPLAVVSDPSIPRPAYNTPVTIAGYGVKIRRVGGDNGAAIAIGGSWGKAAVHHYSKDQPWNHDMSMFYLIQRGLNGAAATQPSKMICSGSTYLPIYRSKVTGLTGHHALLDEAYEVRWRPEYPTQMVSWKRPTSSAPGVLKVFDVITQQVFTTLTVAGPTHLGLLGEGVLSDDGRYLVLCTNYPEPRRLGGVDWFCIVDLVTQQVGPQNAYSMPYSTGNKYGEIGWCSISALGVYVVIKYKAGSLTPAPGTSPAYSRVFHRGTSPTQINLNTLVCTPHTSLFGESARPLRMGDTRSDPRGWIASMSHPDFRKAGFSSTSTPPFYYVADIMFGGIRNADTANWCNNSHKNQNGSIIAQSMDTGKHVHLSKGTAQLGGALEASDEHCSGRCYRQFDRVLVTYMHELNSTDPFAPKVFSDEIVILQTSDPTLGEQAAPIRVCATRSDYTTVFSPVMTTDEKYAAEAHGVPSPNCEKVMFASNWMRNGTGGSPGDSKAYIVESST